MLYIPITQDQAIDPPALHIPDGFLSAPVSILGYVAAGLILGLALRHTNRKLGEKAAPLMGVLAAFIFAAQMINFPVAGGTSGHLLGGTLAAVLLGPWAAVIVMASVVSVQALIFQDGGLVVLGANVFNMGVVTAFGGYAVYAGLGLIAPARPGLRLAGVFVAAWASVMAAAALTSLELALSGTSPLDVSLPAMLGVHALIGIGEGLITLAAVSFVRQSRPDLIEDVRAPLLPSEVASEVRI
jgi:cobalt/nickel transport system permease protein